MCDGNVVILQLKLSVAAGRADNKLASAWLNSRCGKGKERKTTLRDDL